MGCEKARSRWLYMGCEEVEVDDYVGSTTVENIGWVLLEIKRCGSGEKGRL
jgi:hypothetical protein